MLVRGAAPSNRFCAASDCVGDGDVFAVGNNDCGQLGTGDYVRRTTVSLVPTLRKIGEIATIVAAGDKFSFAATGAEG